MSATEQQVETATFVAYGREHQLVRRNADVMHGADGTTIVKGPESIVSFAPDGKIDVSAGDGTEFTTNGVAAGTPLSERDESGRQGVTMDLLTYLRQHPDLNVGYFELGNEPDAVRPTLQELMPRIAQAIAAQDVDTLADIYWTEQQTHNRPEVIGMIDSVVDFKAPAGEVEGDVEPEPEPEGPEAA